jgi:hypothetical protein
MESYEVDNLIITPGKEGAKRFGTFSYPIRYGAIYLSPVIDEPIIDDARRREILRRFRDLKTHSRLPTYLYLIQRL